MIVFGAGLSFAGAYFSHRIFELRWSIVAKFCSVIGSVFDFIIPVQAFWGPLPKDCRGQKHAKFGPILDDFKLRWQMSPERIDVGGVA